jgi:hypothetical protein
MKLQVVTAAAAALLVASVAALPAPLPLDNNHGLLPDTDDWVDDDGGVVEVRDTEAVAADVLIAARDVDDGDEDDVVDDVVATVEVVVETRDNHATGIDEMDEELEESIEARDVDDDDDGIVVTIEEGLEARDEHVPEVDEVDEVDEDVTEEEDDVDGTVEEGLEARDDHAPKVDEVAEGEEVDVEDDDDVTATIEVLETRDTDVADDNDDLDNDNTEDDFSAVEARKVQISDAAANFNWTSDYDFALDRLLAEIESIPDDVLAAGDEALHKWLVEHGDRAGDDDNNGEKLKRDEDSSDGVLLLLERGELVARASWWKVTKCVAAIVQLLATTAVPAAKLLRIKKYIEALGGVKQAVQLLLGATTKTEKLKAGGEALVALSAELLGISTVKNNCF